jgi:hypothetical protein
VKVPEGDEEGVNAPTQLVVAGHHDIRCRDVLQDEVLKRVERASPYLA